MDDDLRGEAGKWLHAATLPLRDGQRQLIATKRGLMRAKSTARRRNEGDLLID
jgi:hypothetical protein